ncbi:MAG: hypothetical protein A2268_09840 [Candidatus Raymondbacteria bacterium RifOxyA12_full_50_37]|uniref:Uncharacterized protein n=1 Tax=Candidatus Raymondbacteria bacterium RIFOXYD12_FULL_49_13 TaxID=1817890 RepID=A0A1F7F1R3_UNCRA|nr:MAG: hypothetical protein A2268_09840 [Candidatus Raymondbacteria bacterium RifOxyA12_full_50_37]OGJ93861.1 MAG: hypothetical protein A2248_06455 [Candidatus Raymondbacteria bacterium RIFOXYA2_FULL_49_16]OGJ98270.1 MAG: hypothetical protein A2453_00710 [Candidatus Raymondbacteria bacterium RIFOXYC2_FULL_50_21]OGJ98434.1 MAG: hypothetical protein A2350_14340 [Candidatus Raymondbacteria bacterium RifOxyB12_full_50_8]OGK00503.1 MAG: hypothetical protein A2519_10885 [Candidatus Raymondbacteria b
MIKINLLHTKVHDRRKRRFPIKVFLALALFIAAGYALFQANHIYSEKKGMKVVKRQRIVNLKRDCTPFDVVEETVDDIHGGRFKVKNLNRLSSPAHLSVNEKKLYERLYVNTVFDALNSAIKPGMGFNTISIDNYGNLFVYGITKTREEAEAFRADLEKQECILNVEELQFKDVFREDRLLFALKGFLSYNVIEKYYEDDTWEKKEVISASKKTVLENVIVVGQGEGVSRFRNIEWGDFEEYGTDKKHTVRFQIESAYPALMGFIKHLYRVNYQVGYSQINLTSVGNQKILAAIEMYIYSKN